jgi:hypothetical protein
MPRSKLLNGVAHDIAHHAMSSVSYLHPHLTQVCSGARRTTVTLDLLKESPLPADLPDHEPLRLASQSLHRTFTNILRTAGFTVADLKAARLTFHVPTDAPDDYSYVSCDSEIVAASGKVYRHELPAFSISDGTSHRLISAAPHTKVMRRWPAIVVVFVITLAALASIFATRSGSSPPALPEGNIVAIDVFVGTNRIATITNAAPVLTMLRSGRTVPPHGCAAVGLFVLHLQGAQPFRVGFYPGHSESEYEFSAGGAGYVVSRREFLSALFAAGVDATKIPQWR